MTEETFQSSLLGKIAAYTEILQKDPRSTIFVSLGEAYRKLGHFAEARRIIENGLNVHPEFSPGYIVLARILCQLSDYEGSQTAFEKALKLDENSLAGLVGYARLAVLTGNDKKARTLLLTARGLSPADPVINKLLNSLPPMEPDEEDVEPEEDVEEDSAPLVSETLADLYLKQGLPAKALEMLRELSRKDPDNLKLRRMIRDAELMVGETTVQTSDEPSLGRPATPEGEERESEKNLVRDESTAPIEAEKVSPESPTAAVEGATVGTPPAVTDVEVAPRDVETPLQIMNRWLENIQKRRADV